MTNAIRDAFTEQSLSEETGIARAVIANVRGAHLTPGDDFANVPKTGITFTLRGLEKIRSLLAPLLPAPDSGAKKDGGGPGVTLIVALASQNGGRTCLCYREGTSPPVRAFVTVLRARQRAATLQRGMRLTGCTPVYPGNDELFAYHGPVPARLGQPLPDPAAVSGKKEARP